MGRNRRGDHGETAHTEKGAEFSAWREPEGVKQSNTFRKKRLPHSAMKILYITEIYPDPATGIGYWGGGERQFYEISRRMSKSGHDVTVLTCRFPPETDCGTLDGVTVKRSGMTRNPKTGTALASPYMLVKYIVTTVRQALKIECDLIHCNAYFPVIAGRIAASIKRCPVVSTFHDVPGPDVWKDYSGSTLWGWLGYLSTVFSLHCANGPIIGVSEQTAKKIHILRRGNVVVVPNGVDLQLFNHSPGARREGQILYVGRLVSYKRVGKLIEAFGEVVHRMPEARLVIVGEGPERHSLERLAELTAAGRITFAGTVPSHERVAELYRQSSLFVLPSVVEGEGITLKEAMAAMLPVVTVKATGSGVQSVVKDGWNGALVERGDPHSMAMAIIGLLENRQTRQAMGRNGRSLVESWTWNDVSRRTLEVYKSVLGGTPLMADGRVPEN